MPNQVICKAEIKASLNDIEDFLKKHVKQDGSFDFDSIVPQPKDIQRDELNNWRREHWGTKWQPDAFDFELESSDKKPATQIAVLKMAFMTASSVPEKIFQRIAELYPSFSIAFYAIGDDRTIAEKTLYKNGKMDLHAEYDWETLKNEVFQAEYSGLEEFVGNLNILG